MRSIFFTLVWLVIPVNGLLAQGLAQTLPAGLKPRIGVTVYLDGKPINKQTGIKIDAKRLHCEAALDIKPNEYFNDFQSELVMKETEFALARNGHQIARVTVNGGHLPTVLIRQAQAENHLLLRFTLIAQRKNGELVEHPVYNFPIQK